jgi:hypothetical protein
MPIGTINLQSSMTRHSWQLLRVEGQESSDLFAVGCLESEKQKSKFLIISFSVYLTVMVFRFTSHGNW